MSCCHCCWLVGDLQQLYTRPIIMSSSAQLLRTVIASARLGCVTRIPASWASACPTLMPPPAPLLALMSSPFVTPAAHSTHGVHYSSSAASQQHASQPQAKVLSVEDQEKACWSCKHHMKRGSYACQGCERIQPVDPSLNYFELFGLPNLKFDVDVGKLEQQYKLLQWSLHPDKVILRPPEEQHHAAQQATLINHAYSILRHPLSRANYLLSLKGIEPPEQTEGTIDDKELLMEILEAREAVEDTDDVDELRGMLEENQEQQAQLVQRVSKLFQSEKLAEVIPVLTRLTYLSKLERELKHKLPPA